MLKLSQSFLFVAALMLLASCGNSETKKTTVQSLDSIKTTECYVAIDGKDTAFLDLTVTKRGDATGDLLIKYTDKPQNKGTVAGKFSGDTLFVDYTFINGENKSPIYKNPLAFLKKEQKLTLGVGVIETTMGRSYFAKDKPINFERGKFIFELCKD